jgi:Meckel syndrome type 1 protein
VRGTVTSRFGDGRNHQGVDIAAPVGTAVRAAACGTVRLAASQSGYGNIICIQHSSTFSTCYAHLSQMNVRQGMYVNVGQVVGRVGMTGRTSGPHLHFETRVGGRAQDPAPYLGRARSIPGEPQARTTRAMAPKARVSTDEPVARAAVASEAPQGEVRAAVAAQVSAPPPAPPRAAAPEVPEPAPAPAPAPEPAPAPAPVPDPAPAPAPEPAAAQPSSAALPAIQDTPPAAPLIEAEPAAPAPADAASEPPPPSPAAHAGPASSAPPT